jgi:hypothetical protein
MDLLFELYDILLESDDIKPYLKVEFDPKKKSLQKPLHSIANFIMLKSSQD